MAEVPFLYFELGSVNAVVDELFYATGRTKCGVLCAEELAQGDPGRLGKWHKDQSQSGASFAHMSRLCRRRLS